MTITFDEDLILPILTAVLVTAFLICYQTLVPKSTIDELLDDNAVLFSEVSAANHEIDTLTKELDSYRTTIDDLESAGASHTQAIQILKAAEIHNLDPKP